MGDYIQAEDLLPENRKHEVCLPESIDFEIVSFVFVSNCKYTSSNTESDGRNIRQRPLRSNAYRHDGLEASTQDGERCSRVLSAGVLRSVPRVVVAGGAEQCGGSPQLVNTYKGLSVRWLFRR